MQSAGIEGARQGAPRLRAEWKNYVHRNPMLRGLVLHPEQWRSSSYRYYDSGEAGPAVVNEVKKATLKFMSRAGVPSAQ